MKRPTVRFTPEAARLLSHLHPEVKKLIRSAIDEIQADPFLGDELEEELRGLRSYKPRRYRIIYEFNEEAFSIDVYYVGHRRDVYDQFRSLLKGLQED